MGGQLLFNHSHLPLPNSRLVNSASKCWKLPFYSKNEFPALERKKGTLKINSVYTSVVYYSICSLDMRVLTDFTDLQWKDMHLQTLSNLLKLTQTGPNIAKVSLPDNTELHWPLTYVRPVLHLHRRLRERQRREKVSTAVTQHAGGQSHTALAKSDGVYMCECVCVGGRGNWACGVLFRESPSFEWGNPSFSLSGTWAITPFRCQLTA